MKTLLISFVTALVACVAGCTGPDEVVVWDFRKGTEVSVIGWSPKNDLEVSYRKDADIDFTLISKDGYRFHQRVFSIGAMRYNNQINEVHAHFGGKNPTLEQAIPLIKQILTNYSGGLENPPPPVTLDDFYSGVKSGKIRHDGRKDFRGLRGGRINIESWQPDKREKSQVVLTFFP